MFDEQPDGDPHGECREEIERLRTELEAVKKERDNFMLLQFRWPTKDGGSTLLCLKDILEVAEQAMDELAEYKKALQAIIDTAPGSAHRIARQALGDS